MFFFFIAPPDLVFQTSSAPYLCYLDFHEDSNGRHRGETRLTRQNAGQSLTFCFVVVVFKFQIKKIYVLFILLAILEVFIKKKKVFFFFGRKNGAEQCASFQTMLLQIGLLFIYVIGIFGFIGFLGRPINCWVGLVYNKLTS